MHRLIAILLLLTYTTQVLACAEGLVPENGMRIPIRYKPMNGGLTHEDFDAVINEVEAIYASEFNEPRGSLNIVRLWEDDRVNASASRTFTSWNIEMYGGFARHPQITRDGFSLVLCHEIGHHIGGNPKHPLLFWMSVEGQADYFGTSKCLRQVFLNEDNATAVKNLNIPQRLKESCSEKWKNAEDKNICLRTGMAALSVTAVLADISPTKQMVPTFDTPETKTVDGTAWAYPSVQCRLDNFLQGALDAPRSACWFKSNQKSLTDP